MPSGILNTFTYNADGLRVQRQDSTGTSKQIWDGQKVVEETDQNNVVQVVYTQSAGKYGDVVSQRRSGLGSYFLFDPLGSAARLTDGGQGTTDSYLFKAFGESLLGGSTANPFRYVGILGYFMDKDLGSNFLRAREYLPTIARFAATDLSIPNYAEYQYSGNSPVSLRDPSGWQAVFPLAEKMPGNPDDKPQYGTVKFGESCSAGCVWIKPEGGPSQWFCVGDEPFAVDGIYICKDKGYVYKLVDTCTIILECETTGKRCCDGALERYLPN